MRSQQITRLIPILLLNSVITTTRSPPEAHLSLRTTQKDVSDILTHSNNFLSRRNPAIIPRSPYKRPDLSLPQHLTSKEHSEEEPDPSFLFKRPVALSSSKSPAQSPVSHLRTPLSLALSMPQDSPFSPRPQEESHSPPPLPKRTRKSREPKGAALENLLAQTHAQIYALRQYPTTHHEDLVPDAEGYIKVSDYEIALKRTEVRHREMQLEEVLQKSRAEGIETEAIIGPLLRELREAWGPVENIMVKANEKRKTMRDARSQRRRTKHTKDGEKGGVGQSLEKVEDSKEVGEGEPGAQLNSAGAGKASRDKEVPEAFLKIAAVRKPGQPGIKELMAGFEEWQRSKGYKAGGGMPFGGFGKDTRGKREG